MEDTSVTFSSSTFHYHDNPDSIEIGTPAKGGAVKIYGDFNKPEEFEVKVANAERVKRYAQERLG